MKYFMITGGNGYCGCDFEEVIALPDEVADEVESFAIEFAIENAESYEYVVAGWNNGWKSEEEAEDYYGDAVSYTNWWEISEEKYKEFYKKNN